MPTAKEVMNEYLKTREEPPASPIAAANQTLSVPLPKPVVTAEPQPVNLEDTFQDIFGKSKSGTGEEELLRIASQFSLQITAPQMKLLIYLLHRAEREEAKGYLWDSRMLKTFVVKWLEYKQNNNSDVFVMKALEHISLRHYINENSFKVNIEK